MIVALVSQAPATLWILYGQEHFGWSTPIAGLSLAGYGACHALAQAFAIGPLIARLGERRALALGLAGDALGLVAIAFATAAWVPFALLPLFAAGGRRCRPCRQCWRGRSTMRARVNCKARSRAWPA